MYNSTVLLQVDLSMLRQVSFPFFIAFFISLLMIPAIIKMVHKLELLDHPCNRKIHQNPIPTMGGIAIVCGTLLSIFFLQPAIPFPGTYVIMAMLALFLVGLIDDSLDLTASFKLFIQFVLGAFIAYAGIRIQSFHGLFGIHELPEYLQYAFTILAIAGVTNAFNLIDGIDGLAGGLSIISLLVAGTILLVSGDQYFALLSFALAGGVGGFLLFNRHPAKIFMGDTGSLVIGFVIAVVAIRMMQVNMVTPILKNIPVVALSLVLIPVFDTMRVFTFRLSRGESAFKPDKTHIHHLLTNAGFNHGLVSRVICMVHALLLFIVLMMSNLEQELALLCSLIVVLGLTLTFKAISVKKQAVPVILKLDLQVNGNKKKK